MGNWTNIKIKTSKPKELVEALFEYCDKPTNPYAENSRDWEMSATIDVNGDLNLTGNEIFEEANLEEIIKEITEIDFEIQSKITKSAIDWFSDKG